LIRIVQAILNSFLSDCPKEQGAGVSTPAPKTHKKTKTKTQNNTPVISHCLYTDDHLVCYKKTKILSFFTIFFLTFSSVTLSDI
jgi:hypothetical protein